MPKEQLPAADYSKNLGVVVNSRTSCRRGQDKIEGLKILIVNITKSNQDIRLIFSIIKLSINMIWLAKIDVF